MATTTDEAPQTGRATLTVKVPPAELGAVLSGLDELGTVLSTDQQAQDVTDQLVDLAVRIRNAEQSVDRVRDFLEATTDLRQMVDLEGELTRRQTDLEQLLATQANLTRTGRAVDADDRRLPGDGGARPGRREPATASATRSDRVGTPSSASLFAVGFVLAVLAPFLALAALVLAIAWFVARPRRRRPADQSPRRRPRRRRTTSATTRISLAPTIRGDARGRSCCRRGTRTTSARSCGRRPSAARPARSRRGRRSTGAIGGPRPRPARAGPGRQRRSRRARPRAARSRRRSGPARPPRTTRRRTRSGSGSRTPRPSASDGSSSAAAYVSLPIVHCSIGASQMCSAQSACALTSSGSARTGTSHSATCSSGWPSVARHAQYHASGRAADDPTAARPSRRRSTPRTTTPRRRRPRAVRRQTA